MFLIVYLLSSEGKQGKAVRVFFRKLCEAVKRPDRVVRLTAQTDARLDDPEVTAVPGPAAVPELLCLPGQVCEDPETRSSGIREPTLLPDPSTLNLRHSESLVAHASLGIIKSCCFHV